MLPAAAFRSHPCIKNKIYCVYYNIRIYRHAQVFDYESSGRHRLLGQVETNGVNLKELAGRWHVLVAVRMAACPAATS